jgi:hypothetical protein
LGSGIVFHTSVFSELKKECKIKIHQLFDRTPTLLENISSVDLHEL